VAPTTFRVIEADNSRMLGPLPSRGEAGSAAILLVLLVSASAGCGSAHRSPLPVAASTAAPAAGASDPPGAGSPQRARRAAARRRAAAKPHPVPPAHPVPAAFQPAPGAPSDAEVRAELTELEAVKRRVRRQQLSAEAANLAGLLPWSLEPKSGIQVSVASVFRDYGYGLACGGVLGRAQLGVAHKTAPCGTLVTFIYAGRSITVPVIDRGPYVAGREWDLTGATADALAFPGLGQIQWSVVLE
jgi:rare lipoprotein A (peptidoglycan hydrolase)